ncbi:DnaJ domain-containing protein [Candidatus Aalborgicola defluviihabitans]|uniref:DnaJ domain-containing protein n=1 Tax=Candidatus Aalborgicola defluviihabitans TaxID=3386187 RepID=UPI0039B837EB
MDIREAYRELGLNPNADDLQLKDAWRRLVSRWHPDRNRSPDAAVRIQRINKAYHHIRECRDDTDAPQEDVSRPNREAQPFAETQVIERLVKLSIEEAMLGCIRVVRGQLTHECRACSGKGQRILAAACKGCRGSGAIKRAALFGWLWTDEACGACGGDGRQREQCQTCEGEGSRVVRYQRSVRFPAGVRAGTVLTVPSSHHDGFELLLEIRVQFEEHPFFVLEDGILRCEMPVDGYAWIANRWVDVPAPGGLQQMRLNRDALVYRLRGKGFPSEPRGPQGDYIVKVVPTFGSLDDPAQQKLLDRLILASEKAADASKDSALGQWRRSLKSWSKAEKKAPKD